MAKEFSIPEEVLASLIFDNDAKLTVIADSLKSMDENIKLLTKSLTSFVDAYGKLLSQQGLV